MLTITESCQNWDRLIQAEKEGFKNCFKKGCSKCENGRIRKFKKTLGWNVEICSCWYKFNYMKEVFDKLQESNLPKSITYLNPLKKYDNSKISFEKIKSFYNSEQYSNWLYIQGEVGAGKTFMAVAVAQIFLLNNRSVYFSTVTELLENLRPNGDESVIDKINACDLLILDDIGQEKVSSWVIEKLYMIINKRYNDNTQVIFTSNDSVKDLANSVNKAVYSRVKGKSIVLNLEGYLDRRIT